MTFRATCQDGFIAMSRPSWGSTEGTRRRLDLRRSRSDRVARASFENATDERCPPAQSETPALFRRSGSPGLGRAGGPGTVCDTADGEWPGAGARVVGRPALVCKGGPAFAADHGRGERVGVREPDIRL